MQFSSQVTTQSTGTATSAVSGGGTASVTSGTASGASAAVATQRPVYLVGERLVCRWNVKFDGSPQVGVNAYAGLGNLENGVMVGYTGASFGIVAVSGGSYQYYFLQVSSGCTLSGSVVVVINGTSYSVGCSSGDSVLVVLGKVAAVLAASFQVYVSESGVWIVYPWAQPASSGCSFTVAATGVTGGFTQVVAGKVADSTVVAQQQWNGPVPAMEWTWSNGNQFEVQVDPLGWGSIRVLCVSAATEVPVLLHTFSRRNSDSPFAVPVSYLPGVLCQNNGCGTVTTTSSTGFVWSSGRPDLYLLPPKAVSVAYNSGLVSVGGSKLLTVSNPLVALGARNGKVMTFRSLYVSSNASAPTLVTLYVSPAYSAPLSSAAVATSVASVDFGTAGVVGAVPHRQWLLPAAPCTMYFDLENLALQPQATLTATVTSLGLAINNTTGVELCWVEL